MISRTRKVFQTLLFLPLVKRSKVNPYVYIPNLILIFSLKTNRIVQNQYLFCVFENTRFQQFASLNEAVDQDHTTGYGVPKTAATGKCPWIRIEQRDGLCHLPNRFDAAASGALSGGFRQRYVTLFKYFNQLFSSLRKTDKTKGISKVGIEIFNLG